MFPLYVELHPGRNGYVTRFIFSFDSSHTCTHIFAVVVFCISLEKWMPQVSCNGGAFAGDVKFTIHLWNVWFGEGIAAHAVFRQGISLPPFSYFIGLLLFMGRLKF